MSVEITAIFTCDWCQGQARGYGGALPRNWTKAMTECLGPLGEVDLCHSCSIAHREAGPELKKVVRDFWFRILRLQSTRKGQWL